MSIDEFLTRASKTKKKLNQVTETDIEKAYVKYARSKGCIALKLIMLRKKGFPDRTTLLSGGHIFFIEFKKKNEGLQPLQVICKNLLESFGFEYYVCDEIGQAEAILDDFLAFN